MRKRTGRQPRFAAVPNETIDDAAHLDLTALGLLTVLLRHRDGWEITLSDIGKRYGYGEDAMAAAMGLLQVAQYVVKVRVMSTEGNRWSTEVVVYDTPASDEEIADLLTAIAREAGVRQVQFIEPTQAATNRAAKRQAKLDGTPSPTRGIPGLGGDLRKHRETAGRPDSGVSRDSGNPRVSKKTVSKKTKNTSPPAPPTEQSPRQSQAPLHNEEGEEARAEDTLSDGAGTWVEALPWRRQPGRQQRDRLAVLVAAAWAAGWSPEALRQELVTELEGVRSLYAVWSTRLEQLPAPVIRLMPRTSPEAAPSCPIHPGAGRRAGGECAACWSDRLDSGRLDGAKRVDVLA
ncbi:MULTISPECIES: hypothetical protein [Streptosporangium]|uniref:Uncharacterized protein n=1 Tax=Streptosporangium brasiliense TaxID=47480 RepID=A0ABT9RMG6_9ACTN|nr:hypothetical protein [Streptosporangium brasiliense]MDP9870483.1 hypothetical protein [Streptosporangium brasiliense]